MAETTYREILLVVESAGAPEVQLYVPGQEQPHFVLLNPVKNFRHHRGAEVLVADVPAPPGARLQIESKDFEIRENTEVLELARTTYGWEEGTVASDASPLTPNTPSIWQVPALGWMSWFCLAGGFAWLARRVR